MGFKATLSCSTTARIRANSEASAILLVGTGESTKGCLLFAVILILACPPAVGDDIQGVWPA